MMEELKMLKRILAISAALLVGASLAFAQTTADGGAKAASAGSVNASWGNWKSIPKSKIGTDMFNFKKEVVITPNSGSKGGKFALEKGETKFKTESYTALYHNNKGEGSIEKTCTDARWRKAVYTITIDDAATITLTVAGNGSKEQGRCVVLGTRTEGTDAKGKPEEIYTPLVAIDNLSQDEAPKTITYKNAPKGTYYIIGNGHRIVAVEAKN